MCSIVRYRLFGHYGLSHKEKMVLHELHQIEMPLTMSDAMVRFLLDDPDISNPELAERLGLHMSLSIPFFFFCGGVVFVAARWDAKTVIIWKGAEDMLERMAGIGQRIE
jgi:hypothetical protein